MPDRERGRCPHCRWTGPLRLSQTSALRDSATHIERAHPERNRSTMTKSLAQMGEEVLAWCTRKGWEPDPERSFGDECALLHSEVSEALEHYRDIKFESRTIDGKPEDVASEFADVLIRLVHYARTHGIDLEAEYERKMAYNEKRPWRHGGRVL